MTPRIKLSGLTRRLPSGGRPLTIVDRIDLSIAPGEFVEVVQRDLTPAALARMGFVIQAGYSSDVTTDLMVGED